MNEDARWIRIQTWKPVRQVFQAADSLFEEAARLRAVAEAEAAAPAPAPAPARGKAAPPPGAPAAYLRLRRALREVIDAGLDPTLLDAVGARQKYLCLTVIASFIDERERVALGALADTWQLPLLQSELLDIDDGGDRFFTQLHDLLLQADVDELVFEVYLLCLRAGFVGRYDGRRHDLDKLTETVIRRLRPHPVRSGAAAAPATAAQPTKRIGFIHFPLRYYVGVAVLAVLMFIGLRVLSDREVARSSLAAQCHHDEGGQ